MLHISSKTLPRVSFNSFSNESALGYRLYVIDAYKKVHVNWYSVGSHRKKKP